MTHAHSWSHAVPLRSLTFQMAQALMVAQVSAFTPAESRWINRRHQLVHCKHRSSTVWKQACTVLCSLSADVQAGLSQMHPHLVCLNRSWMPLSNSCSDHVMKTQNLQPQLNVQLASTRHPDNPHTWSASTRGWMPFSNSHASSASCPPRGTPDFAPRRLSFLACFSSSFWLWLFTLHTVVA